MLIFDVVFLITSIFQTYIYYLWMQSFLGKYKVSRGVAFFAYLVMYIAMTVPYLLLNIPTINLLFAYASNIGITLIYNGKWKIKIIIGTFLMVMMAMTECVVAVFSGYIRLNIFHSNDYYSIFGTVCLPIFQFMVVLIIRNYKNMRYGNDVPILYWGISILLPLLSIYLLFTFYRQSYISRVDIICSIIVLIVINVFVFALYDRQAYHYKIEKEKDILLLQNEYQENQLNVMNKSVEDSRSQKHDFLKHISIIKYLAEQEKNDSVEKYIEEIYDNVKIEEVYIDTGNFVIDSILNYKFYEIKKNNIELNTAIKIPENIAISKYDINVILSNILDNAIEAVALCNKKCVDFMLTFRKNKLIIELENTYKIYCCR